MPSPLELNASSFISHIDSIKNILKHQATEQVTFWGTRVVVIMEARKEREKKVAFGERAYNLSELADKLYDCIVKVDHMTENECRAAKEVLDRLRTFYRVTDGLIEESCLITRIVAWVREQFHFSLVRSRIEGKQGVEWWIEHRLWYAALRQQLNEERSHLEQMHQALERIWPNDWWAEFADGEEEQLDVDWVPVNVARIGRDDNCAVCLESLHNESPLVAHRGGEQHPLHSECMRRSLEEPAIRGRCPVCRTPVLPLPNTRSSWCERLRLAVPAVPQLHRMTPIVGAISTVYVVGSTFQAVANRIFPNNP